MGGAESRFVTTEIGSQGECKRTNDTYQKIHQTCEGPARWAGEGAQGSCNREGNNIEAIGSEGCRYYGGDAAGTGFRGTCVIAYPRTEDDKYQCCTKAASDTSADLCGRKYCSSSDSCKKWLAEYCTDKDHPDRMAKDVNCSAYASDAVIGSFCSKLENFKKDECQKFCQTQYSQNGPFLASCNATAEKYCETDVANKPECACLVAPNTKDFKDVYNKLSPGALTAIGNYQCWWKSCQTVGEWNNMYRSQPSGLNCPACVQTINIDNVDDIGKIYQSCGLDKDGKTKDDGSGDGSEDWKTKYKIPIIIGVILLFIILLLGIIMMAS
jgi:hypothetical protein